MSTVDSEEPRTSYSPSPTYNPDGQPPPAALFRGVSAPPSSTSGRRPPSNHQPHRGSSAASASSSGRGSGVSPAKSRGGGGGGGSAARPASASDAARGRSSGGGGSTGYSARVLGGSPNLNAAAAALAERQAMADMMAAMRSSHCRCRTDGGQVSNMASSKRDVESVSEELRQARASLAAVQEQNRILRTEKQRLEDELGRCRSNLAKAEEMLSGREIPTGSISANQKAGGLTQPPSSLVNKLREQLAAQQAQSETLKAQLDMVMRGTRATKMAELQAQVRAQEQELTRQLEMLGVMKRRMLDAEAQVQHAINKGQEAERLARLQLPMAALQHAIELNEVRHSATAAILDLNEAEREGSGGGAAASATGTGGRTARSPAARSPAGRASVAKSPVSRSPKRGPAAAGGSPYATALAAFGVTPPPAAGGGAEPSALQQLASAGAQSLSSGRIRKTMAALGEAHRALYGQASLLSEIFPPGLTTEQLCVKAALKPATAGAPEVLRYLRHHVHRLVDAMSCLPGSRLEFVPEEEVPNGARLSSGGGGWASPSARRGRNGRSSGGGAVRVSGGGNAPRGGKGPRGGGGVEDYDPWALVGELLDYVRWLRSLNAGSLQTRPDLESGLEQVSTLVVTCQQETQRLMDGATDTTAAAKGGAGTAGSGDRTRSRDDIGARARAETGGENGASREGAEEAGEEDGVADAEGA